ncbi:MAG: pyridoxamine 5'-phosphate oxidase family protein [Bacteroidota bacterium]
MEHHYTSDIAFTPSVKKQQEAMGSRKAYQKMAELRDWQATITDQLRLFISQRDSFYMASSNAEGQPYIQHRGGPKGFLKAIDDEHLAFADYSGNRQYISIGNFADNNKVHLFLMDYPNRKRIKIWGEASVITGDAELTAQLSDDDYDAPIERVVIIKVKAWDVNCPQHIQPRYTLEESRHLLDL